MFGYLADADKPPCQTRKQKAGYGRAFVRLLLPFAFTLSQDRVSTSREVLSTV